MLEVLAVVRELGSGAVAGESGRADGSRGCVGVDAIPVRSQFPFRAHPKCDPKVSNSPPVPLLETYALI